MATKAQLAKAAAELKKTQAALAKATPALSLVQFLASSQQ
jgi:hypothetical protein